MKIELKYFGRPGELLRLAQETAEVPSQLRTVSELLSWLRLRGGVWATELAGERVCCAVNLEFADASYPIHEHDEIAIFSPISGG